MEVKILCASAGSLDLVYHDLFTMMPQMAFADEQAPAPHDASLASRYRLRWQLRPLWTFTTDERHARHTHQTGNHKDCRFFRVLLAMQPTTPQAILTSIYFVHVLAP